MLSSQNDNRLRSQSLSMLWLFSLLFGIASACPVFAAKPSFTTSLDRESVIVGETVVLTLKFEGVSPKGMPSLPQIPGLQALGGVSSSVNSSIGPEGMTSYTSYSVNLLAQQAGDFVIPALAIEIDGQKLQSQPVRLKVLQSDPNAPAQDLGDRLAFLSLSLPKNEMFVGKVLP